MEKLQLWVALKRRNRAVSLTVPVVALYLAVILALGLFVLTGYLSRLYLNRHTDYGRLQQLVRENYLLKAKVTAYAVALDTFRQFLALTEEMDNRLRAASDLYLIPPEARRLGIGGVLPADPTPEVGELLRRVKFEQRSLGEIERQLKARSAELSHIPSIWPVQGWVTSWFGMRHDPFTGQRQMHEGMDIVAPRGSAVVAPADGRVTYAGWKSGWGRCIEIDHGNGIHTFFAHCQSLRVNVGDNVSRGKIIATVGSSGRATGTHLHYGVMRGGVWVNPRNYIVN
ncbi:MAG: M23 family metallopeptidase [candidate division WOR-3 bacterium]